MRLGTEIKKRFRGRKRKRNRFLPPLPCLFPLFLPTPLFFLTEHTQALKPSQTPLMFCLPLTTSAKKGDLSQLCCVRRALRQPGEVGKGRAAAKKKKKSCK